MDKIVEVLITATPFFMVIVASFYLGMHIGVKKTHHLYYTKLVLLKDLLDKKISEETE